MSANAGRKPGIDRRLSRQITRPNLLNHRPRQHVIHVGLAQARLGDEARVRQSLQVHGELIGVDGGGLGEGEADAVHYDHCLWRVGTVGGEGGGGG